MKGVGDKNSESPNSKDRQYNDQLKRDKILHNMSPLKTCVNSIRVSSSCSISDTRRNTIKRHEHHLIWKSWWIPEYVNESHEPSIKQNERRLSKFFNLYCHSYPVQVLLVLEER